MRLAVAPEVVERRAKILVFPVAAIQPFRGVDSGVRRADFLRENQAVGGMGAAGDRLVGRSRESLERVLPDGLEHHEPRLLPGCLDLSHQTLVDEGRDPVEDV